MLTLLIPMHRFDAPERFFNILKRVRESWRNVLFGNTMQPRLLYIKCFFTLWKDSFLQAVFYISCVCISGHILFFQPSSLRIVLLVYHHFRYSHTVTHFRLYISAASVYISRNNYLRFSWNFKKIVYKCQNIMIKWSKLNLKNQQSRNEVNVDMHLERWPKIELFS